MTRSFVHMSCFLALWGVATCDKIAEQVANPSDNEKETENDSGHIQNHHHGKSCEIGTDKDELAEDAPSLVEITSKGHLMGCAPCCQSQEKLRLVNEKNAQLEAEIAKWKSKDEGCCVFRETRGFGNPSAKKGSYKTLIYKTMKVWIKKPFCNWMDVWKYVVRSKSCLHHVPRNRSDSCMIGLESVRIMPEIDNEEDCVQMKDEDCYQVDQIQENCTDDQRKQFPPENYGNPFSGPAISDLMEKDELAEDTPSLVEVNGALTGLCWKTKDQIEKEEKKKEELEEQLGKLEKENKELEEKLVKVQP